MMQDGLLMAFGPDGDPIPPRAFVAAAAERPEARVGLAGGERVPASRVARVLEVQTLGRLGSVHGGGETWVMAMLGLGPQPEATAEAELAAEDGPCGLTVFGADLMISLPAGRSFLLAEARSPGSACARLSGPEGEPVTVGGLVTRLRLHLGEGQAEQSAADSSSELRLAGCMARIEHDALVLDLPGLGALHLCPVRDPAGPASLISAFLASGEPATMDDLLGALSLPTGDPVEALGPVQADIDGREVAGGQMPDAVQLQESEVLTMGPGDAAGDPEMAPPQEREATAATAGPAPGRTVGLALALPGTAAASAGGVAMVVISGLGKGAALSAGIDNGDGSWSLTPEDLAGLALAPSPTDASDLVLEVRAITVKNRDGDLASASKTIRVPLASAEAASGRIAIPVLVDPDLLRQGGAVDAIMVRDLPAGTGLSVGTFDPSINAWVLLPSQLGALVVTPAGGQGEDFTLTLTGIALAPAGPAQVLARIPIAMS